MAAQFPGKNNGGGGGSEAEAAAVASLVGLLMAAAKESMLTVMREQQQLPPPPPLPAAMGGRSSILGPAPIAVPDWPNNQNTSGAANQAIWSEELKKCELCNVLCTSLVMIAEHEKGKRHQKNLRKSQKLEPAANEGGDNSEVTAKKSQKSKKKKGKRAIKAEPSKAESDDEGGEMEPSKKPKTEENGTEMPFKCFMCNIKCIDKEAFDRHLCGKKHKSKVRSHWAKERPFLGLQAVYPPQTAGTSASSSLSW